MFELQYGQYTDIPIVPDDESGELPPREALYGTSAGTVIEIVRSGFRGNVCDERKSDITKQVEQLAYVAHDEDETAWTYAGNREANYSPEAISDVGPFVKVCIKARCQDGQPHVTLMRGRKKYGAGWLGTGLVAVGLKIKCCGSQPVWLPEELVERLMRDLAPDAC